MQRIPQLSTEPIALPPRSRLYHLPRQGVGSEQIECLSSFIIRLAEAHGIDVGPLIYREVLPLCAESGLMSPTQTGSGWLFSTGYSVNGCGNAAESIAKAVSDLTMQPELAQLTMLPFVGVISPKEVVRKYLVWCPDCWREWDNDGQPVYIPLQWLIAPVNVCARHHGWLQQRCPYSDCARQIRVITGHAHLGQCPWCKRSLWNATPAIDRDIQAEKPTEEDLWVAEATGKLLAMAQSSAFKPGREALIRVIDAGVGHVAERSRRKFARLVFVNRSTLRDWTKEIRNPTITHLLRICWTARIDPAKALLSDEHDGDIAERASPRRTNRRSSRKKEPRTQTKLPEKHIRCLKKILELTILVDVTPPPSLESVARELSLTPKYLRRVAPDLTAVIVARYQTYRHERGERVHQRLREAIETVCLELDQEGTYPSTTHIIERLNQRGLVAFMRDRFFLEVRQAALEKLGWVRHANGPWIKAANVAED